MVTVITTKKEKYLKGTRTFAGKKRTSEEKEKLLQGFKKSGFKPKPTKTIGRFGNGEDLPKFENLKEERKAQVKLNKKLRIISDHKHKLNIPWNLVTEAVTSEGFVMPLLRYLDDNKPGRIHEQIGNKTWLVVQWYPFQNDTFEIVAYAT